MPIYGHPHHDRGSDVDGEVQHRHYHYGTEIVIALLDDPSDDPDYDGSPLECPGCWRSYDYPDEPEVDGYECEYCGDIIESGPLLGAHVRHEHGDDT